MRSIGGRDRPRRSGPRFSLPTRSRAPRSRPRRASSSRSRSAQGAAVAAAASRLPFVPEPRALRPRLWAGLMLPRVKRTTVGPPQGSVEAPRRRLVPRRRRCPVRHLLPDPQRDTGSRFSTTASASPRRSRSAWASSSTGPRPGCRGSSLGWGNLSSAAADIIFKRRPQRDGAIGRGLVLPRRLSAARGRRRVSDLPRRRPPPFSRRSSRLRSSRVAFALFQWVFVVEQIVDGQGSAKREGRHGALPVNGTCCCSRASPASSSPPPGARRRSSCSSGALVTMLVADEIYGLSPRGLFAGRLGRSGLASLVRASGRRPALHPSMRQFVEAAPASEAAAGQPGTDRAARGRAPERSRGATRPGTCGGAPLDVRAVRHGRVDHGGARRAAARGDPARGLEQIRPRGCSRRIA